MGPDSLPPLDVPTKSFNLWLVVSFVFIAGIGAGVLVPAGLKYLGANDTKVLASKEPLTLPMPNGKTRRIDPPISNQPAAPVVAAQTEKPKIQKSKQKFAAAAFHSDKKMDKAAKTEKVELAKAEKSAPSKEKPVTVKVKAEEQAAVIAKNEKAPSAELIEEVPSALTALQVEKLMQNNSVVTLRNQKAMARPVALPPGQGLAPGNLGQGVGALPLLKSDPQTESKTYPVSINNASFSKATLSNCSKRCALLGMDAMGHPIRAIIDGPTYAAALKQHNGTINISGQPRIVKNQQVLVVENITFNLASTAKSVAKRGRSASAVAPVAVEPKTSGYTEVSFEGDDLKPGTVIKNRKQIPVEDQQEIPAP